MAEPRRGPERSEIGEALHSLRGAFASIALFSGAINLLALTSSIYMMQVYDRVLSSRSVPTLAALTLVVVIFYLFQGFLEVVRSRITLRIGAHIDAVFGRRTYLAVLDLPLRVRALGDGMLPLRDLDTVRTFLSGPGPIALLDLPWMPIFLIFTFILSPWLCLLASIGAVVMIGLTVLAERMSREPAKRAAVEHARRFSFAETSRRNTEALFAMGMSTRFVERWAAMNDEAVARQLAANDTTAALAALSKVVRYVLQSATLGLGAYLVIRGDMAGGSIIAASIATTRALAPIEVAIANWKNLTAARQAGKRLETVFAALPERPSAMELPPPVRELVVDHLYSGPPRGERAIVQDVGFRLEAGQGLGIIGPSSAGKSSLIRAIVGVWAPLRGTIALDGAPLDRWDPIQLGRHVGYLPQDCELFDGTVAENISRFDPDATSERIIAACRAAGVYEFVQALPNGFSMRIGEGGSMLSAGQRQRIGLARALYGDPFLVVLDEPNSNLDAEGDAALTEAIRGVRDRRGIVIVVAHRPSAIAAVDLIAVLGGGRLQAFGPKDDVLKRVLKAAEPPSLPGGPQGRGR